MDVSSYIILLDAFQEVESMLPWWAQLILLILGSAGGFWGVLKTWISSRRDKEYNQKEEVLEILKKSLGKKDERISDLEKQIKEMQDRLSSEVSEARKESEKFWKVRINDIMKDHDEQMDRVIAMLSNLQKQDNDHNGHEGTGHGE
jgi:septal ring factor EnvC (AmiA/AmiB activator)